MSKSICIIKDIHDYHFIKKRINKPFVVLPLSLSVQIYCIEKKIIYLDPIKFIKKDFHEKYLVKTNTILENINIDKIKYHSVIEEIKGIIRFNIYSILLLKTLLDKLQQEFNVQEFIVVKKKCFDFPNSPNNNYIFDILKLLEKNIPINAVGAYEELILNQKKYKYQLSNKLIIKKNTIILSNLGYNFRRIFLYLIKKRYNILILNQPGIRFYKKILLKLFGVHIIDYKKILINNQLNDIENYKNKYIVDNFDISPLVNQHLSYSTAYIYSLIEKISSLEKIIKENKNNIKLYVANFFKGLEGSIPEIMRKVDIPSVCISHGTLSQSFNQYDRIYKKIISKQVCSNVYDYCLSQSKISNLFFDEDSSYKNVLRTGNIIFSSNKKKNHNKNKFILYAVTQKPTNCDQLLGCELYFEFIDNLRFLSKLAQTTKYKFIVKLHPVEKNNITKLKLLFNNLIFSNDNIDLLIQKVDILTSFSSTVIEDSINSYTPVILLDRYKRYRHCKAETNVTIKNKAIYYVTNSNDYINAIKTINSSHNINFDEYLISSNHKKNIDTMFKKILHI